MAVIIPAIVGAILIGRAFDLKSVSDTATVIFDDKVVNENLMTIQKSFTTSTYRVIDSSSDVNSFFNIDGELSLKVKSGNLDLSGMGKYLKSTVSRENTVEILMKVSHQTVAETIPSYLTFRKDWQVKPPKQVGTHYIRSIVYGGELFISYRMIANSSEYVEDIKAAINSNLQLSGSLDGIASGKFKRLRKDIREKCLQDINAYATTPIFGVVHSLEKAFELIENYPEMVKKINNKKGSPLKIELVPLSTLKQDYEGYIRNNAINGLLEDVINKYDDLNVADARYRQWDKTNTIIPNEKQQEMINEFYTQLIYAKNNMSDAIIMMDTSISGKVDQFDKAFESYGEGKDNIPHRYSRWLNKIFHEVEGKPFIWYPYTIGVTHYTHWGNVNCTFPSPEPMFPGYATTTPRAFGNGGDMHCLPQSSPSLGENLDKANPQSKARIAGVRFRNPKGKESLLYCAYCKLENATSTFTIPGTTRCPGGTKLEYSGFYSTEIEAGTASPFICIDRNADITSDENTADDEDVGVLSAVWISCPTCEDHEQFVPCVVCSR